MIPYLHTLNINRTFFSLLLHLSVPHIKSFDNPSTFFLFLFFLESAREFTKRHRDVKIFRFFFREMIALKKSCEQKREKKVKSKYRQSGKLFYHLVYVKSSEMEGIWLLNNHHVYMYRSTRWYDVARQKKNEGKWKKNESCHDTNKWDDLTVMCTTVRQLFRFNINFY